MKERFDKGWEDRWVKGTPKSSSEMGKWKWTAGKWYGDKEDKGVQTGEDARFYSLAAKLDKEFDNKDKDLVIQFTVKHEQDIDCGGGYIKLLPNADNLEKFGGDDEYAIMFGPDICGTSTRKTHVIFGYNGENLLTKKEPRCETDTLSHMYTLIVRKDNTYEVQIDGNKVESGSLYEHWDFLPPKQIPDPEAKKPDDWVDEAKIPDPEDKKPEGWDDIPAQIPDPEAEKPDDWDEEEDGEWEPPMIDNPEYKGEWKPRMIDNPEYKGEWKAPMIDNPEYFEDDEVYHRCRPCRAVGFELWQVKAGTIFDDIIVTDSEDEAKAFADETFFAKRDAEKKMYDDIQEEKRKKEEEERKQREEEEAEKKEAEDEDDDDEEDEDEEDEEEEGHDEL